LVTDLLKERTVDQLNSKNFDNVAAPNPADLLKVAGGQVTIKW
jgi:hypothetical protein